MTYTFIPPSVDEFDNLFLGGVGRGGGLGDIKIFHPVQRSRRGGGLFTFLGGLAKKGGTVPFPECRSRGCKNGKGCVRRCDSGEKNSQFIKKPGY